MKIFTQGILARRKILLLFLLAILLPSLVVGFLSYRTFSEKQQALQNFLESNLWVYGESALKEIEARLFDMEKESLKKEKFLHWLRIDCPQESLSAFFIHSRETSGWLFLLDKNDKVVLPRLKHAETSALIGGRGDAGEPFLETFRSAEAFEFAQRDYSRSLEEYRRCLTLTTSEVQKAVIFEAMGRCLVAVNNQEEAYETYEALATRYDRILNKAGHPYGLTARLRMFDIAGHLDSKEQDLESLLQLYEKLQGGKYPVDLSAYEFFQSEIQTILETKLAKRDHLMMQKSYERLKSKESPYRKMLYFSDFLEREAVPKLKEDRGRSRLSENAVTGRLLVAEGENDFLLSYVTFPDFQGNDDFCGGICWDLEILKANVFPKLLADLRENSKLDLRIIDAQGRDILKGNDVMLSDEALPLSFRQFPLPWQLAVKQPALDEVVRTTRRNNVFYGVLLGFVVVLMFFGAALIARDISRETETTRLKTEFVHHVSHELKTPLTLIRLYGETLQRKKDLSASDKDEAYEIITKESERLSHLINNVLDFSRIEMGKKEFDFKKGDLAGVVKETLESYRYHLEKKGFTVKEEIARDLPEMTFDAEGIASILINLLSNAIKFSPDTEEVVVKLLEKDGHAVLQIEDRGIGISAQEISRVFDKFYRSSDVKAADAKGSGLGLTLVKHITKAHGGRIEVHSELGQGSVFSIFFPLTIPKKDE